MRIGLLAIRMDKAATGLSNYVAELAPRLCDAGHKVTVIGTDCGYRGAEGGEQVRIDSRADLKVFPVRGKWNRRLYRSPEMKAWFRRAARDFDVVDIQSVWSWAACNIAEECRTAGVPYVFTTHGAMTRWDWQKHLVMKRVFFHLKLGRAWHNASAIRFHSQGEVEQSMVRPRCPFVVIPNAVDPPAVADSRAAASKAREQFALPSDVPILLFVGRVTDQKGILELLGAFDLLRRRTRAELVIAGPLDGDYGAMVRQRAASLGGNVHLLGPVYGEAKFGLYAAASLFVTLSKSEGLPVTALDALHMQVPVVLTRDSNLPEAEAGQAGITTCCEPTVAAKDIADLLLDSPRLDTMRRRAPLVARQFTWHAVLPRLVGMYESVAAGRRPQQQEPATITA